MWLQIQGYGHVDIDMVTQERGTWAGGWGLRDGDKDRDLDTDTLTCTQGPVQRHLDTDTGTRTQTGGWGLRHVWAYPHSTLMFIKQIINITS